MSACKPDGFSLVELMIAMTLGIALGTAVIQVTLASQRSQRLLDASARLQESGRFAASFLIRDLRTAGYMGCPNLNRVPLNIVASNPPSDLNFTVSGVLAGEDNVGDGNRYSAVVGSDVVTLQRGASPPARIIGSVDSSSTDMHIHGNPAGLGADDFMFITDCGKADLVQVAAVSTNQSDNRHTISLADNRNELNRLGKTYNDGADVLGFQSLAYFVRDTRRKTPGGETIHALYLAIRKLGSGAAPVAMELVEGVEDMQLTYGEDTDGDRSIDVYHSADAVTDWSAVLSVHIQLLMQSLEDNVVGNSGAFSQDRLTFNGSGVPKDGRLRQVYSTAVAIRNRLP